MTGRPATRTGLLLAVLALGLAADAGERPRSKRGDAARFFAKGGQGPPAWTDPTGVTWSWGWGFDQTLGPRALVGGVDLERAVGFPPLLVTPPASMDPGGLGLGPSVLDLDGSQTFVAEIPALAAPGPVHVRIVCAPEAGSNGGDLVIGENGDLDGAWMRLAFGAPSPAGGIVTQSFDGSGGLAVQNSVAAADGDVMVIDFFSAEEVGTPHRSDVYLNGQVRAGGSSSPAAAWPGPAVGRVALLNFRGQVAFIGVRRVVATDAEHATAVRAAITGALLARDVDYRWRGADAVQGAAWVDAVGGLSAAWNGAAVATVGATAPGLGAAYGALDAARIEVTSGVAAWVMPASALLAQPAGASVWIRIVYRHVDPASNTTTANAFEVRETNPGTFQIYRSSVYHQASGRGRGLAEVFNESASRDLQVLSVALPDRRPFWNILDVRIQGTGAATLAASGVFVAGSVGAALDAIDDMDVRIAGAGLRLDIAEIALAFGARADVWSEAMHTVDLGLVELGP